MIKRLLLFPKIKSTKFSKPLFDHFIIYFTILIAPSSAGHRHRESFYISTSRLCLMGRNQTDQSKLLLLKDCTLSGLYVFWKQSTNNTVPNICFGNFMFALMILINSFGENYYFVRRYSFYTHNTISRCVVVVYA